MKILKILYVCWIMFWGLGCIVGGFMGHYGYDTFDKIILKIFFSYLLVCLCPLLFYLYNILLIKAIKKSKTLFIIFTIFLVFVYTLAFFASDDGIILIFLIAHIVIFVIQSEFMFETKNFIILLVIFIVMMICFVAFRDISPSCFKDNQPILCEELYNEIYNEQQTKNQ